jgi:hypothetical protein
MPAFKDFVEGNPSADLSDGTAKFAMLGPDGENAEATLTAVAAAPAFTSQYAPRPAVDGTAGQALKIASLSPLVTEWGDAGGGGSGANLAWNAATSQVTSDTGTDATLTAVDGTNPGLMTVALKSKLDGIEALADVTDTANVTAAGALMDSEVDADIKTLSLPANTTISTFGASLVDDADQATARTTLGLGTAATTAATDYATAAQGATADGAIPKSLMDAKGDLIVATAADTVARVAVGGTNGHVLTVDSAEAAGVKWAAAAGGGGGGLDFNFIQADSTKYCVVPGQYMQGGSGAQAHSLNTSYYTPFIVSQSTTLAGFLVNVSTAGTAATSASLSIYSATDSFQPDALVVDLGTIAIDSTGIKTKATSQVLSPGRYLARYNGESTATLSCPLLALNMWHPAWAGQGNIKQMYDTGITYSATAPATPSQWAVTTTASAGFYAFGVFTIASF